MNTKQLIAVALFFIIQIQIITDAAAESDNTKDHYNKVLYKSQIEENSGSEVVVREVYFPPGWKTPKHYHNGSLFIYVIEGEFEVTTASAKGKTYRQGEVLEMRQGIIMQARNPSESRPLKLAVFQIGKPDTPFLVPAE